MGSEETVASSPRSIGVYILDDHQLVRDGLRHMLSAEPDITVVGEAATATEALDGIPSCRPDVAVLDVRLPDGSGVEVCREIRSLCPEVACLMLTSFADDDALFGAVMAGASGYVLKEVRGNQLVTDIRQVASGHSLIAPDIAERALEAARTRRQAENVERLTTQEERILTHISEGLTNRQIADKMYLSEKTVKNYVSNLLAKLGMSRRTEAAVYAIRRTGSEGTDHR